MSGIIVGAPSTEVLGVRLADARAALAAAVADAEAVAADRDAALVAAAGAASERDLAVVERNDAVADRDRLLAVLSGVRQTITDAIGS